MKNQKIEKITIVAIKDDTGRATGFVSKNGSQVEFYSVSLASFDEIEEILKALVKDKLSTA